LIIVSQLSRKPGDRVANTARSASSATEAFGLGSVSAAKRPRLDA
jgi:hypothetical protein